MNNEEFVRQSWNDVTYADTATPVCAGPHYVIIGGYPKPQLFAAYRHTPEECWEAAAEFTRDWLEEIRQREREIAVVEQQTKLFCACALQGLDGVDNARDAATFMRLRGRLERRLDRSKSQMKQ